MFLTEGESIPSVGPYLERIKKGDYLKQGIPSPSLEFLDELIYAHHCTVPFENIEIYDEKRVPSLNCNDIYEKIVLRKRGGYCFELNALFYVLLRDLGFDAYPCLTQEWETPALAPQHRATIVRLDGALYFCDVGFGGPVPAWAFKIADGFKQTRYGDTFEFEIIDEWFWLLSRCKKNQAAHEQLQQESPNQPLQETPNHRSQETKEKLQVVCLFPQQAENFIAPHYYCSTLEDSFFTIQRLLNLKTTDGYYSITNMTFKQRKGAETITRQLQSKEELLEVYKNYFSIEL